MIITSESKIQPKSSNKSCNKSCNGCPFSTIVPSHKKCGGMSNIDFWPNSLNLSVLRQNDTKSNPLGVKFNYAKAFKTLDIDAVVVDLNKLMTDSQEWWPADFGNYGPLFIRMAWHSAGTYRAIDGRGGSRTGEQRFAPLNSWPDNANLDKARRLLWPIKQKYGQKISWADLFILTGTIALQNMGLKIIGFGGGRADIWEPQEIYWGPENKWLDNKRYNAKHELEKPLASVEMGLIYVNPEGPNGHPNPIAQAHDIRTVFNRMSMNDYETVALTAGGHTFGKCHGAAPASNVGPAIEEAGIKEQNFGWKNKFGTGNKDDTITSGIEGAWHSRPIEWGNGYLKTLYENEWKVIKGTGNAFQWTPKISKPEFLVPSAHNPKEKYPPMMTTADIALRVDPIYNKIALNFYKNHEEFTQAFSEAWFKLTHRDMGPKSQYLGKLVPKQDFIWQDPVPSRNYINIDNDDIVILKSRLLNSGLSKSEMIRTAWSSASTFRRTDYRGGSNGARVRLLPQKNWEANNPQELQKVLNVIRNIYTDFNKHATTNKRVSIADLIVLAGNASIESAALKGGFNLSVPFTPGRTDAIQKNTDIHSFNWLEPTADGFRNYTTKETECSSPWWLVEKANLLGLTAPEMTILVGGMRVLDANYNNIKHGVFTMNPGTLSNDFFVNLLDMNTIWTPSLKNKNLLEGRDRKTNVLKWTGTLTDMIFGSNSELRALAEVYADSNAKNKFAEDFIMAWTKVMNANFYPLQN